MDVYILCFQYSSCFLLIHTSLIVSNVYFAYVYMWMFVLEYACNCLYVYVCIWLYLYAWLCGCDLLAYVCDLIWVFLIKLWLKIIAIRPLDFKLMFCWVASISNQWALKTIIHYISYFSFLLYLHANCIEESVCEFESLLKLSLSCIFLLVKSRMYKVVCTFLKYDVLLVNI